MLTAIAFIVALGLLVTVHEYGHYRVAVACGVRVLRFSVGFGRVIYRWRPRRPRPGQDTEFTIGLLPLGGYVRMLDEREGPVDPAERDRAFNNQSLGRRAAIVAAGPLANLLTAILLYAGVAWIGTEEPVPVIATPVAGSLADQAGLRGGEWVQRAAVEGGAATPVPTFEALRWLLVRAALDGQDVELAVGRSADGASRPIRLPLSSIPQRDADAQLFRRIGLLGPWTQPVIGEVQSGGAAERSGLRKGDLVLRIGDQPVVDGAQLRELIRASVGEQERAQAWTIERSGGTLVLNVRPEPRQEGGRTVGRIGAYVGAPPSFVLVRAGPFEGIARGVERTWEMSALSLRMIGRMLIGEASLRNLSGPLTIADYAGRSASLGIVQYLAYLAMLSVSLGVLNLLPIPVLDGGHLMYYLWEGATGRSIPERWVERLQRSGIAILLAMMCVALFNDVARLLG